jgi:hypothetical protein
LVKKELSYLKIRIRNKNTASTFTWAGYMGTGRKTAVRTVEAQAKTQPVPP